MKVVIVDDSILVRERLNTMVSDIDSVEIAGEAGNALDGINVIKEVNPDVVILDIRMPIGSGIEVLKYMRRGNPLSRTIILTNYPYEQYRQKCLELGADFFLDKATEIEKIPGIIDQILREKEE